VALAAIALLPGLALLLPATSGAQAAGAPGGGAQGEAQQPGTGPAVDAAGASGMQLYNKYCAQCHGEDGRGRGIASRYLRPAPRDFTSGKYQVRSTATGSLPTDDDLRRVITTGMPGTAMPAFPDFTPGQVDSLVAVVKAFSSRFASGQAPEPLALAGDPGYDEGRVEEARQVYEQIGCAGCHGRQGRGDGPSAPTLRDDWGQFVRAADLSKPWTFNGGGSREDIFRSISTGLNGTPMAGFQSALTDEQRWQLVDFIQSLAGGELEPGYDNVLLAHAVEGELDLARGRELFAEAPAARFPLFGQVVQPGRSFQPSVLDVEARAVFNDDEVAVLVTWSDIRAERTGNNGPDFELPAEEELPGLGAAAAAPTGDAADPFADEETPAADPFAEEEQAPAASDPFADEAAAPATGAAGDPWGDDDGGEEAAAAPESEFSDAVAVQFPRVSSTGVRRPYFIFGDELEPVELWFVDLAAPDRAELWEGRGSSALEPGEGDTPEVAASYQDGEWTVVYKRRRSAGTGITFPADSFVPVAFSVWDGFHRDRGNQRSLSAWYHVYMPPAEQASPVGPMVRAAGAVLLLELLVVFWARRRSRRAAPATAAPEPAA
jgi:mono/diheme cytochrome c family protein